MAGGYDNTNKGALFVNQKKNSANSPDFTGSLDVEGVEYWVSMWKKTSKAGKPFLSLALTPKEAKKADAGDDGFGSILKEFDREKAAKGTTPTGDFGSLRDDPSFNDCPEPF